MHFLYVFILQFLYNSTRFERPFRSSSGVHDLLYCSSVQTMQTCLIAPSYGWNCSSVQTMQTCLIAPSYGWNWFQPNCRYSKSWTSDDERNGRSKHVELYKNCGINTYRKCILLVCWYNWLRCTVHTTSKKSITKLTDWAVRTATYLPRRRDFHLKTHNIHKRQTSKPPAGFEPSIPAS